MRLGFINIRSCLSSSQCAAAFAMRAFSAEGSVAAPGVAGGATAPLSPSNPPKWSTGEIRVLKPQFRMGARRIKKLVEKAELEGYIIVERKKSGREEGQLHRWQLKEPKGHKFEVLLEKRKIDIEKALKGQQKTYEKHKKKLQDKRRTERQKGIAMMFKRRGDGKTVKKGPNTWIKKRRAIGEG